MHKKDYINAEMEIIWFDTEDVITTSDGNQEGGEDEYHDDL